MEWRHTAWRTLEYHSLLVTVAGCNGGGDHPIPAVVRGLLLLLMWEALFSFSSSVLSATAPFLNLTIYYSTLFLVSYSSAPIIGWLADVKFGRYKMILFGTIASFLVSILYYAVVVTSENNSTVSKVLLYIVFAVVRFGATCYEAAMLPFLTDQIIGATSDELSSIVRWYYWDEYLGIGLSQIVLFSGKIDFVYISNLIYAIPLAVIIISDCLCQQWLDRTHKVTNPIKLIIQVLNYTRKHRYPERRSAFTYIDEEQPTRMDYGKEKFGGPFTEEEVEDVKTVLRLLPLVISLSLGVPFLDVGTNSIYVFDYLDEGLYILNTSINITWLFALIVLEAVGIIVSDGVQRYLSCIPYDATDYGNLTEWYWKLGPYVLYGVGYTAFRILILNSLSLSLQKR